MGFGEPGLQGTAELCLNCLLTRQNLCAQWSVNLHLGNAIAHFATFQSTNPPVCIPSLLQCYKFCNCHMVGIQKSWILQLLEKECMAKSFVLWF